VTVRSSPIPPTTAAAARWRQTAPHPTPADQRNGPGNGLSFTATMRRRSQPRRDLAGRPIRGQRAPRGQPWPRPTRPRPSIRTSRIRSVVGQATARCHRRPVRRAREPTGHGQRRRRRRQYMLDSPRGGRAPATFTSTSAGTKTLPASYSGRETNARSNTEAMSSARSTTNTTSQVDSPDPRLNGTSVHEWSMP